MRRRLFALFLLLVLLIGYFAYLNSLPPAVRAYKLARISGDEKLIAAYHDKGFWQFATYNPKTQKLKVYALYSDKPILPWGKDVKTVKTPLNYSPLALDLDLLKEVPKETPALLFAGKWYTKENPPKSPAVGQILRGYNNKTIRRIALLYARKELWIQTYLQVYGRAYEIGTRDVLVVPSLGSKSVSTLVIEFPTGENNSTRVVYYPSVTVTGQGETFYLSSFNLDEQLIDSLLNVSIHHLTNNTSFAKIESYCFFPNAGLNWVLVKKYFKGISMEEHLPSWYLSRKTEDTPLKCNKRNSKT